MTGLSRVHIKSARIDTLSYIRTQYRGDCTTLKTNFVSSLKIYAHAFGICIPNIGRWILTVIDDNDGGG